MEEKTPKWLGVNPARELEKKISSLDIRIENLKIKYNQFFAGEIPTPPEKERETLERELRKILGQEQRSPRINLLVQNTASKFTLFNNRWLKKLHDKETDIRPPGEISNKKVPPTKAGRIHTFGISLNQEASFDRFIDTYRSLMVNPDMSETAREKLINSLKSKMISANIVDAQVSVSREEGKLRIRLKK